MIILSQDKLKNPPFAVSAHRGFEVSVIAETAIKPGYKNLALKGIDPSSYEDGSGVFVLIQYMDDYIIADEGLLNDTPVIKGRVNMEAVSKFVDKSLKPAAEEAEAEVAEKADPEVPKLVTASEMMKIVYGSDKYKSLASNLTKAAKAGEVPAYASRNSKVSKSGFHSLRIRFRTSDEGIIKEAINNGALDKYAGPARSVPSDWTEPELINPEDAKHKAWLAEYEEANKKRYEATIAARGSK